MIGNPLSLRRCSQAGMSLVEIAIVLGIIGLMTGGIWALAAAVTGQQKIAQAAGEVNEVVSGAQAYSPALVGIPNFAGGYVDLTNVFGAQNVIPPAIQRSGGCGANVCADGPWGQLGDANGSFRVCPWSLNVSTACSAAALAGATFTPQVIAVEFTNLNAGACVGLVSRLSGPQGSNGLLDVSVNGYDMLIKGTAVHPVPIAVLNVNCTAASKVDFVYRLTQPTN